MLYRETERVSPSSGSLCQVCVHSVGGGFVLDLIKANVTILVWFYIYIYVYLNQFLSIAHKVWSIDTFPSSPFVFSSCKELPMGQNQASISPKQAASSQYRLSSGTLWHIYWNIMMKSPWWPPSKLMTNDKSVIISDISNLLYLLLTHSSSWALLVNLLSGQCHTTPLMISQQWFR